MAGGTKRRTGRAVGWLVALLVIGLVALGFFFRQDLTDMYRAYTFEPSERIAQIASDMKLTDSGERVFYATHPTIEGSQRFTEQCSGVDHTDDGHLLGCYSGDRIRLFEVDDDRINEIVDVTAAHELLHASYSRLRSWERASLQPRLIEVYEQLAADDPELRERMSVYEHLPRDRFANEVHSVLGTEILELPQDLEKHFGTWFENRAGVVERFETFRSVFDDLRDRADGLRSEMDDLRASIDERSDEYTAAVEQFNADVLDFNARNERYEFSNNPAEFERIRLSLADRRDGLESTLEELQSDIDRYNGMRDELIELGEVSDELDQKLDANLAPV